MHYDPEALYQDADIEQAEMEREGARLARLEAKGICTHGHVVGYRVPIVYPEQEGLKPGQKRCSDCKVVFDSDEAWLEAIQNL